MDQYPYTQSPLKLKDLLGRIHQLGVPASAGIKWLASIGFRSSNDRTMVPVLRFIGLTDSRDSPTQRWIDYRGDHPKRVLAECIREGYAELFSTYLDAHRRSDAELKNFFKTHSSAGEQVIAKTVSTFRVLCELADFGGEPPGRPSAKPSHPADGGGPIPRATGLAPGFAAGMTVNINIQLSLPETTDETVYDRLFASLRRHLGSWEQGGDGRDTQDRE